MSEPAANTTEAPAGSADPPTDRLDPADDSARPRVTWARAILVGLVLLLVLTGAAALVLTLAQPLADEGSSRLTARELTLLTPRLAQIDDGIDRLVDQGAALAVAGREVLTRARALDPDGVDTAITAGSQAAAAIARQREDLIKRRETLMLDIEPSHLGDADRTRIGTIDRALVGATQLPVSWVSIVGAAADPRDLVRAIAAHDAHVVDATAAARADDLPGALAALEDAQRSLVPARAVRQTANEAGADVSTLDDLLARLDAYDRALTRLYTLLPASGGTVTDEIRTAYEDVGAAQGSLPRNTDALSIVVSDLAGQAITAALVDIESQRALVAGAAAARPDADGG